MQYGSHISTCSQRQDSGFSIYAAALMQTHIGNIVVRVSKVSTNATSEDDEA